MCWSTRCLLHKELEAISAAKTTKYIVLEDWFCFLVASFKAIQSAPLAWHRALRRARRETARYLWVIQLVIHTDSQAPNRETGEAGSTEATNAIVYAIH
jgi:hypothetical protein